MRKVRHLLIVLAVVTWASVTLYAATLGNTSIGGTTSGTFSENFVACIGPFTASQNGTITDVSVWTNTAVNITLGVYNVSGGVPTSLVGNSVGGDGADTNWTTRSVSGSLVSGSTYCIGLNTAVGTEYKYDTGTGWFKFKSSAYSAGTLPSPFGTEDGQATSRDYSAYITYTPSAGAAPCTRSLLRVGCDDGGDFPVVQRARRLLEVGH